MQTVGNHNHPDQREKKKLLTQFGAKEKLVLQKGKKSPFVSVSPCVRVCLCVIEKQPLPAVCWNCNSHKHTSNVRVSEVSRKKEGRKKKWAIASDRVIVWNN